MEQHHYGQERTLAMRIFTGEGARNVSMQDILDWMDMEHKQKELMCAPRGNRLDLLIRMYVQDHYTEIVACNVRMIPREAEEQQLAEMYMERLHLIPGNYKERMYNRLSHFECLKRLRNCEYREQRESFAMLTELAISARSVQQLADLFGFSESWKRSCERILQNKTSEGGRKHLLKEIERIDPTLFCGALEGEDQTVSGEAGVVGEGDFHGNT
ncbi:hypothetical protein [Salinispira pacifica]|nr:hypothetical protein [Salinispira pacifica]